MVGLLRHAGLKKVATAKTVGAMLEGQINSLCAGVAPLRRPLMPLAAQSRIGASGRPVQACPGPRQLRDKIAKINDLVGVASPEARQQALLEDFSNFLEAAGYPGRK